MSFPTYINDVPDMYSNFIRDKAFVDYSLLVQNQTESNLPQRDLRQIANELHHQNMHIVIRVTSQRNRQLIPTSNKLQCTWIQVICMIDSNKYTGISNALSSDMHI